jgi:tight adherence protein C
MLILVLIVGVVLLGAAVTLLARAAVSPSARAAETLQQIGTYGYAGSARQAGDAEPERTLRETIDRIAFKVGDTIGSRFSRLSERELRGRLLEAGMYTTSPTKVFGYQFLLVIAGAALWMWLAGLSGASTLVYVGGLVLVIGVCWFLPIGYVDHRRRARKDSIERGLPDLIDLLVVTLEAGLSFPQSLRLAATKVSGPLAQEVRLTLQEQNMGLTLSEALSNFQRRAETPGTKLFARSISQGEQLGVSTGQIMRNLAEEMRKRRRAYAEERAQKAPVKILFPLLFLIFPAIFIVLLLPAILRLNEIL